ncbi:ABC transporter permease [Brevibacillus massiliensis]|jgi:iron(III) transport system permease protein|uniref:ABC transporter permease n=1 Tax=Brevibacillus massiliensis TaxID=1118054 RepID=UPI00030ABD8A|nr:iron ABC transporter permease [Brevibacillus massiliensis]
MSQIATNQQPVQTPKKAKKKRFTFEGFTLLKWLIYLFFFVFLLVPLFSILLVSFTGQPINIFGSFVSQKIFSSTLKKLSEMSWDAYAAIIQGKGYFAALVNSLELSTSVALLVTVMVLPIAYAFARTKMPLKGVFAALCTIPLICPTFISSYGFQLMFGKTGWVNHIYRSMGGDGVLFDVQSMLGIALVQIFFFFPYALWPMVAAFKISDVTLEEASQNLGAKSWYTFLRVTLPLAMPGIVSSMLLLFTVSFSDFGTPIILAPKDLNLIVVEAYREIAGFFNWSGSAVLTVIMLLVAAFFFWMQRLVVRGKEYGTISGKPSKQKLNDHKGALTVLTIYSGLVVLVPLLAAGSVFLSSIATTWGHHALPDGYTLAHYKTIFSTSYQNIVNSMILAAGALVLSVVVATFVSYFVVRRGSSGLDFVSSIPLIVPGIALGIAMIQTFNTAPLQLTGTALLLIIAYTIRRMPYMIRSTMGSMMAIRKDIEEAAVSLGASPLLAALTVIGPLMLPGIAAGAILVFVTVIKETSISILLAPTDWAPMSLAVFQNLLRGEYYTASAMAILIIVIVIILQAIAKKLAKDHLY